MNHWIEHLSSLGARFHPSDATQAEDFGRVLTPAELAEGFVAPVTNLGLIAVAGEDAAAFLHNQLTNDVEHLGLLDARLAGYCTPKGRLMATFLMWRDPDTVYLQLPRAIQPPLQKRLSMCVLRSKAKLRDATEEAATGAVLGLGGAKAAEALARHAGPLPDAPWGKVDGPAGTVIRLLDAFGQPRYLWLTTPDTAIAALPQLQGALALGGNAAWELSNIHAGLPQITQPTQEQFVPQMINYELIGGVNFKKGCYPGQEIVARTPRARAAGRAGRAPWRTRPAQAPPRGARRRADLDGSLSGGGCGLRGTAARRGRAGRPRPAPGRSAPRRNLHRPAIRGADTMCLIVFAWRVIPGMP